MYEYFDYVCIHSMCMQIQQKSEEGPTETGVGSHDVGAENGTGNPLQQQLVLFTTEASLPLPLIFFKVKILKVWV